MLIRKTPTRAFHALAAPVAVAALLLGFVGVTTAEAEKPKTIEDFDTGKLSQRWVAFGKIKAARTAVPAGVKHEGVAGHLVQVEAGRAGAVLAVKKDFPRLDFERAAALRMRLKAPAATAAKPLVIEVQVFSAARRAWFWRKVTLDKPDWRTVTLPLRHFRESPGARLAWSEAHRIAIRFRGPGSLWIDKLELVPGEGERPAYLNLAELTKLAFKGEVFIYRNERFALATDEQRLQGRQVLAAFDKLYAMIYRDLPTLPPPKRPVICLIFADRGKYQTFWRELGKRFNSTVPVVKSDGYTIFGVAGSSYSDQYGAVRPVYIQEVAHSLLAQVLGFSNQSEWLHEGLANYYQLHWSGQDIHELTRSMIRKRIHAPLEQLTSGQPIGQRNYAQAVLFVKWLLADPQRKKQLRAALDDMRQRCSTDLGPLAKKHFGKSIAELEKEWLAWAAKQAG